MNATDGSKAMPMDLGTVVLTPVERSLLWWPCVMTRKGFRNSLRNLFAPVIRARTPVLYRYNVRVVAVRDTALHANQIKGSTMDAVRGRSGVSGLRFLSMSRSILIAKDNAGGILAREVFTLTEGHAAECHRCCP